MKTGSTDITFVLDRSGSMEKVKDDTMHGFNAFIQAQRALPGECVASLVQFDDVYEPIYTAKPLSEAPLLSEANYVPRGFTAYLDATARTIIETGKRLAAMPEDQRPQKVIFVILTDGIENASQEFRGEAGRAKVFEMIGRQRDVYQWDFVFLGANQDAIKVAAEINISAGSSMTYAANSAGTQWAFKSVSAYTARNRSAAGAAAGQSVFTAEDREEQIKAGVPQR